MVTGPDSGGEAGGDEPEGVKVGLTPGLTTRSIEAELRQAYLTYSMSVIVSRALPDVRDGLKPSQRRLLVAMNDLNLRPGAPRVKCAKISGDTSGNYHPHGEAVIYPTLVRMGQAWSMRHVLIDKQGNFGSISGLGPAAMRYTEARLAPAAALMLDDLDLDTVDFVPTYDEQRLEPTVLPARFPNLLVNGAGGIAVGMATSIPPHNLGEVCDALILLIDEPDTTLREVLEVLPGPDFATGGTIMGRSGIIQGYQTGRSTITLRAKVRVDDSERRRRLLITEIPYQQTLDGIVERIARLVNEKRVEGISDVTDYSNMDEICIAVDLKRDADPDVVLNQLYQFSPLQTTFSLNLLALVDGKPRTMSLINLLEEFLRHRVAVLRRRTLHLLRKARDRKHIIEGQLLALANIDEIIRIIRTSRNPAEAKVRLMGVETPAAMMERALGAAGFAIFQQERGVAATYALTPVQADSILRMTLSQLTGLAQEELAGEHGGLLSDVTEYLRLLEDDAHLRALVRIELEGIKKRLADRRRTEISGEEIGVFNLDELISEENMVVTITHRGYIKRTAVSTYQAQRRGGKGVRGAKVEEEDPVGHLIAASTHDYLLFFSNMGRVYWKKVYELPEGKRDGRGRSIANVLDLAEGETIADCRNVRDFGEEDRFLVMATRNGLVKKTSLSQYGRPRTGGIIAIKLREGDELIDVALVNKGQEILLGTKNGRAIRFRQSDARAMGRNTSGVRGIRLAKGDEVVGMVVADPAATLLTVCANGYGKRTPFGPDAEPRPEDEAEDAIDAEAAVDGAPVDHDAAEEEAEADAADAGEEADADEAGVSGNASFRTQGRGGSGIIAIRTSDRNGPVVGMVRVDDDDQILLMTAGGKLQRIRCNEINVIGRNTQGVRIMKLDEGDSLAGVVRLPHEERQHDFEDDGDAAALDGEADANPSDEV